MKQSFQPTLWVWEYTSTRKGDAERGPLVRMRSEDARLRLVEDGELVYIYGPRRHELATLVIDDALPAGTIAARDIAGIAVSEAARIVKPDLDTAGNRNLA